MYTITKEVLIGYISQHQEKWDWYLDNVAFTVRPTNHDVSVLTPNLVNFGREVHLNILYSQVLRDNCHKLLTVQFQGRLRKIADILRSKKHYIFCL